MELHCNNKAHDMCVFCLQGQGVMKHGARGKKQTLKSASTDLGTTDVGKQEMHLPTLSVHSSAGIVKHSFPHKLIYVVWTPLNKLSVADMCSQHI